MPVEPFERPMPRLGNDRFPKFKGYQKPMSCFATLLYASIHLVGRNFEFLIRTEMRVCSKFLFRNVFAFEIFETSASRYRVGR